MSTLTMSENPTWSNSKKIGFRFLFSYFSLLMFFMNNGAFPFFSYIEGLYNDLLYKFIPWIGKLFFGLTDIPVGPNGSGDTTYDYLLAFTMLIVSVIATIIWSLFDRKSINYVKMYYWLTLAIRLYIALMLISYGMVKVIQLQFSPPSIYRLTETYGESSPMGLAWTFLGFSKGYNLFMGIAEVAAVLLLFRRTLTFGLIITLMTTANVMAVNYFFDIPVKILSTHLVLLTMFLLARDFKKLCQFFFMKKAIVLTSLQKPKFKKGFNTFLLVFKILLLGYAFIYSAYTTIEMKEKYLGESTKSPLKGFYEIKELRVNDSIVKMSNEIDITGWKNMIINRKGRVFLETKSKVKRYYKLEIDSVAPKFKLESYRDSTNVFDFTYRIGEGKEFYLDGIVKKDTVSFKMERTLDFREKYLLTNRGFHWISERPYNR